MGKRFLENDEKLFLQRWKVSLRNIEVCWCWCRFYGCGIQQCSILEKHSHFNEREWKQNSFSGCKAFVDIKWRHFRAFFKSFSLLKFFELLFFTFFHLIKKKSFVSRFGFIAHSSSLKNSAHKSKIIRRDFSLSSSLGIFLHEFAMSVALSCEKWFSSSF